MFIKYSIPLNIRCFRPSEISNLPIEIFQLNVNWYKVDNQNETFYTIENAKQLQYHIFFNKLL